MSKFVPIPDCPAIPPDLIAYLRAIFDAAVGTAIRSHEHFCQQTGEQRVIEHLADQLRRQTEGE